MKRRYLAAVALIFGAGLTAIFLLARNDGHEIIFEGKGIKEWCLQLSGPGPNTGTEAEAAIKKMGSSAVPRLIQLLKYRDDHLRKFIWAHARSLPMSIRDKLLTKLGIDISQEIRKSAARALAIVGPDAKLAIPDLYEALCNTNKRVEYEAGFALGRMAPESVSYLTKALDNKRLDVRLSAAGGLRNAGPQAESAIPTLIAHLADPDSTVANECMNALQTIGDSSIPPLVTQLERGEGDRKRLAAIALSRFLFSRKTATEPLIRLLQDKDPKSRAVAASTLGSIRATSTNSINSLTVALKDTDDSVRISAADALLALCWKAQSATGPLQNALRDKNPKVRQKSAMALGEIGSAAATAVTDLSRLAEDTDDEASGAARLAIAKIQSSGPPAHSSNQK